MYGCVYVRQPCMIHSIPNFRGYNEYSSFCILYGHVVITFGKENTVGRGLHSMSTFLLVGVTQICMILFAIVFIGINGYFKNIF